MIGTSCDPTLPWFYMNHFQLFHWLDQQYDSSFDILFTCLQLPVSLFSQGYLSRSIGRAGGEIRVESIVSATYPKGVIGDAVLIGIIRWRGY